MAKATDLVLIGNLHIRGERIAASWMAQLHFGSCAKWRIVPVDSEIAIAIDWWPERPERILPDLLAAVAINCLGRRSRHSELMGMKVRPTKLHEAEVDRLGERVLAHQSIAVSPVISTSSFLQEDDYRSFEKLRIQIYTAEKTSSH